MVKGSKLLAALDAHKERDLEAEKRKKQVKAAEKTKREKTKRKADELAGPEERSGADLDAQAAHQLEDEVNATTQDEATTNGTSNRSTPYVNGDEPGFEDFEEEVAEDDDGDDGEDSELAEDGGIPLSDLSDADLSDTIPHQRLTINNTSALLTSRNRISLLRHQPKSQPTPFQIHNSLISPTTANDLIPDSNDDLTRETQFYSIARTAALSARTHLLSAKIPFTRPTDYFAEMVKSDPHMEKIKDKIRRESSEKRGREEARKQRDAKKFGKQVQVAKEQERAKEKRETLERIKDVRKKRKTNPSDATHEDPTASLFDSISVEKPGAKSRDGRERGSDGPNPKRQKKDSKFGFGGKKRFAKSGDAKSSADMSGFGVRGMKDGRGGGRGGRGGRGGSRGRGGAGGARGGSRRLGKSKRDASRS